MKIIFVTQKNYGDISLTILGNRYALLAPIFYDAQNYNYFGEGYLRRLNEALKKVQKIAKKKVIKDYNFSFLKGRYVIVIVENEKMLRKVYKYFPRAFVYINSVWHVNC